MSMKPGGIGPGLGLGAATFIVILSLPYGNPQALWWAMAGLCALVVVQTVLTAPDGNPLGIFSLAIAAVIAVSAVVQFAAPVAGVDIARHPRVLAVFLAVIVGFPLGVLAAGDPYLPKMGALFWGIVGVVYMPLPFWLSVRLGLNDYMIDVFDSRLRLGHLVGMEKNLIGLIADILGMSIASGVTLLILSLPALPLILLVRFLIGRS